MANPYGITEVNLPAIYGAVNDLRSSRIQQMLGERQVRALDQAAERENRLHQVLARAWGGGQQAGGSTSPSAGSSSSAPASPAPAAPMASAPSPAIAPSAAAPAAMPATQPVTLSPEVASQLIAIDPQQGGQIVAAFRQMDTARREQAAAANAYLATFAQYLTSVPMEQRQAEIQRRAPDLIAHGISQQQIQNFTPDDQSLRYVITSARDIEKLVEEARPRYRDVNGEVIDEGALPAATPGNPVVFRSQYISTPQGLAERPGGGPATPAAPQGPVAVNPRTGERLQLNPQTNQWEPIPPATRTGAAPDWPVPGGAASGQQPFP